MAKTAKRALGDIGEEVVCKYLVNKGYFVCERNYWRPWGEIDVIAKKGSTISFVEVKSVSRAWTGEGREGEFSRGTLSADRQGIRPEENMHPAKLKRLHRAIQTYLMEHKISENVPWQIDLACVFINREAKRAHVELLENIVL